MNYKNSQKNIQYLYRYLRFPNSKDREYTDKIRRLEDIFVHNQLFFPSPCTFNDPFDSKVLFTFDGSDTEDFREYLDGYYRHYNPMKSDEDIKKMVAETVKTNFFDDDTWRQEQIKIFKQILEEESSKLGVISLSEKPDDILMWAHYADGHKGLCLQFDKIKLDSLINCYCDKVDYRKVYPSFKEFIHLPDEDRGKFLLLTKSDHWEYEQEWRLIIMPEENTANLGSRYLKYPEQMLTSVIFGCEMLDCYKDKIRNWIKDRQYKPTIYYAKRKENVFGLKIDRE